MQTNRRLAITLASIVGVGLVSAATIRISQALGSAPKQPAPKCKISPVEAIAIALKKAPGKPLQANFEFDEGHWVYGVMIVQGKEIKEVEIDPMTGKVGGVEAITPEGEAKEMLAELKAAIGSKAAPTAKAETEKEGDEKDEKSK